MGMAVEEGRRVEWADDGAWMGVVEMVDVSVPRGTGTLDVLGWWCCGRCLDGRAWADSSVHDNGEDGEERRGGRKFSE